MKYLVPLLASFTLVSLIASGSALAQQKGRENFDIRTERAAVETASASAVKAQRAKSARTASEVVGSMTAARSKLEAALPGVKVKLNEVTQAPEVIGGGGFPLTAPSMGGAEAVVRGFVGKNAAVYGLTSTQVASLETKVNQRNPAGNLTWVELEQKLNGIPVFQGTLRAALRKDGAIIRAVGNLAPGLAAAALPTAPRLTAAQAVVAAAATVGVTTDVSAVAETASAEQGRKRTLAAGPFVKETQAELVYFPLQPGVAALAYSMVLWEKRDAWYVLVDANSGELLWRKNITNDQTQAATYNVYGSDSPAPLSPSNATPGSGIQGTPAARVTLDVISEHPSNNLGWMTDNTNITRGNNVDAGLDIDGVDGIDANGRVSGTPNRVFNFNYTPAGHPGGQAPSGTAFRNGVVTNLFFWSNRYHDRLYDYGFDESWGNFQTNNFGRGGAGNDPVLAQAQDFGGTNNANFATPPDGTSGRMQMYIFDQPNPDRDGSLDQEIVIHELTHGLSNRLHSNASGLINVQGRGMGEGWSDFYARALLSTPDEDVNGVYAMGAYATLNFFGVGTDNGYYGIRRFPYAVKTTVGPNGKPHNPLTFADIDPAKFFVGDGAFDKSPVGSDAAMQVHNAGEVWCSALLEVRARLINRLGFQAGNDRALQLVTDGMKNNPVAPTFIDSRDSIVDAASGDAADLADVWAGFAAMGMGWNASVTSSSALPGFVVESFITPNLVLGTVTINDTANGNSDGFPDPGEPIVLSIPLRNLLPTAATNVTLALDGGAPISYGTINAGQTVTRQVNYTIPPNTPSGTRLKLATVVDSSFGPVGPVPHSIFLIAGHPVNGVTENFDALSGTALPVGWASTRTGGGVNWVSSTANSDTPSRNLFTPNVGSTSSAQLTTPAIPITSPTAELTFRNSYNLESSSGSVYYDGMVLEVSVNGAPYQDIVEAGGEFVSGGYNATLSFGSNPLSGRNAWSGLSGGNTSTPAYLTTKVRLPGSMNGKSVRFKWIVGCDSTAVATGAAGVRIDSVVVGNGTEIGIIPNRPPVFNAQTFGVVDTKPNGFVIGTIAASDPDPGQTLTYTIQSGNTGNVFALNPTSGQLTVADTVALDAAVTSQYQLLVRVADNGTIPQPRNTEAIITINVRAPGVTPVVSAQGVIEVLEDGSRTLVLADFTITDPDSPAGDMVLTVLDGANYTRTGNTITPAANYNGPLTVPVRVSDGETDSDPAFNASVTVTPVNDRPSFTGGPDQPITDDGVTRTIPNWATNILTGPANESDPVNFTVTTNNDALFADLPTVSPTGTLEFRGNVGVRGMATVTVTLGDGGGTLNGGVNTSAPATFVVTSTSVANDPPTFVIGPDQAAAQDAGPQVVDDFATFISPGPPDEAAQAATLAFSVVADNPALFDVPPAISPGGTLTYTPKPTASGSTTVTVILNDNGGTANGGDETSDPQTFVLVVTTFRGHEGVFNGLALPALGTPLSAEKTGLFTMKVTDAGGFTGRLRLGVDSFTLKGTVNNSGEMRFGKNGDATLRLERRGRTPFFLDLRLDVIGTTDQITGTLRTLPGEPPESVIIADRAFYSKANPPPFRGRFTVLFNKPVSTTLGAAAIPQGAGFGTLEVSASGIAKITGQLADNSPKFTYSNTISKGNFWPLMASFSKGNGALAGRVVFRVVPDESDVDGQGLVWFRPQDAKARFYSEGWPKGITTTLVGSTYVPAPAVAKAIDPALPATGVSNADLLLANGKLSVVVKKVLRLEGSKVTCPLDSQVSFSLSLSNGQFKGQFFHPAVQARVPLQGVVFQKKKNAGGFFLGLGEVGDVTVVPK